MTDEQSTEAYKTAISTPLGSMAVPAPTVISITINNPTQGYLFPSNGNLISLNASSQIPFKLVKNGGNFSSWKSQMTNLLLGYGLFGFVDGSQQCPPKKDPRYTLWYRQDRLVLLEIQATVHSTIGPTINNCATSAEAWSKLETSYANTSNTGMLSLLSSLMSHKKEGKTVADYMGKIKTLVEDLALIGHPLTDGQIMGRTLNGMGDEFKELKDAAYMRDTPISFEDLFDKLLDEEIRKNHGEIKEDDTQITAQLTQRRSNIRGRGGCGSNCGGSYMEHGSDNSQGPRPTQHHQSRPPSSHGRGYNYQGTSFNSNSNSYSSPWNQSFYQENQGKPQLFYQLCDKPGHSAKTCRSRGQPSSHSYRPEANFTDKELSSHNNNWVLDSGATHHITSDLHNLSMHSDYVGNEDVVVGNW
ncbi:hypothetical protein Dsin_017191 [Dipteronia sinensis]|uniref:Retrotransposon Copia-like N-terminal domain-containing protein n=1 Tax=Dipteronia sinensis TaxID=43782 RepID=A0AAE0AFZ6_9ROSI|nr:hypothetical protein Dsin_017191 [Dipteronia sinensis]